MGFGRSLVTHFCWVKAFLFLWWLHVWKEAGTNPDERNMLRQQFVQVCEINEETRENSRQSLFKISAVMSYKFDPKVLTQVFIYYYYLVLFIFPQFILSFIGLTRHFGFMRQKEIFAKYGEKNKNSSFFLSWQK